MFAQPLHLLGRRLGRGNEGRRRVVGRSGEVHAVERECVEVDVQVQRAAEVQQKRDVPAATAIERFRGRASRPSSSSAKIRSRPLSSAGSRETRACRSGGNAILRLRSGPLSQRNVRQDGVDEVRRCVGGAATGAGRTERPILATEGDEPLIPVRAAHPHERGRAEPETQALDSAWQNSVTDDYPRAVIAKGGTAVGKSPLMAANPDLEGDPAKLDAMVKYVRALRR